MWSGRSCFTVETSTAASRSAASRPAASRSSAFSWRRRFAGTASRTSRSSERAFLTDLRASWMAVSRSVGLPPTARPRAAADSSSAAERRTASDSDSVGARR